MEMNDYILNLVETNKMIGEDIINNPSFSEYDLSVVRDRMGVLIEQLDFWRSQNNPTRFAYELKNHIQWMLENYG